MSKVTETKEGLFIVTEYVESRKEITKDQYVAKLRQSLEYHYDNNMNILLKKIKLDEQLKIEGEKMAKVLAEIIRLNGKELADKDLDYAQYRFKELYPKKAKLLVKVKLT